MSKIVPLPKLLSHYTTLSGLMGIVKGNKLWASNASFLNDRSELLHALNSAQASIQALSSLKSFEHWSALLNRVVGELKSGKIPDTFVACFCKSDDNLSQWRGYGGAEQGVSITFNRRELQKIFKKQGARLYNVTYAKVTTEKKLRSALEEELVDIANLNDLLGEDSDIDKYRDLFKRVSSLLPKFKHLGFSDEREWRFVVQNSQAKSEKLYRVNKNIIVPYIELGNDGDMLPIESIRIGPGVDQKLTAQSVRVFIEAHGYRDVKIDLSEIPFRT